MHDITYLKEVEASLSNETVYSEILSSVSEGIIVYDSHLNYRSEPVHEHPRYSGRQCRETGLGFPLP